MWKKENIQFVGLFVSLVGAILIIKNLNITGFAISEIITNTTSYFLPLVLFIGGILIATTSDGLQTWLERKEKEHASPSLEGKVQTKEERKYFDKRYSKGFLRGLLGHKRVMQVQQNEGKYVEPTGEEREPTWREKQNYESKKANEEYREEKLAEEIVELRKELYQLKGKMENGPIYNENFLKYLEIGKELASAYNALGMTFPLGAHEKLQKQKKERAFRRFKEELEKDIVENRKPFSVEGLHQESIPMAKTLAHGTSIKEEEIPTLDQLKDLYKNKAKTVPISSYANRGKYSYYVIHSIPSNVHQSIRSSFRRELSRDAQSSEPIWVLHKLIDKIFLDRPWLCASTARKDSPSIRWNMGVGVILDQGKIYDIDSQDLASVSEEGGLARFRSGRGREEEITKRVGRSVSGGQNHNELIVGDYNIDGLWFDKTLLRDSPVDREYWNKTGIYEPRETVKAAAQEALKRGVKLYEYVAEKEFREVNPKDYLGRVQVKKTPKRNSTRKVKKAA
jgi:hypothetical protein